MSRKLKINKYQFKRKFGKNISVVIKLKNGKESIVNFKYPPLKRNPMFFLGKAKF